MSEHLLMIEREHSPGFMVMPDPPEQKRAVEASWRGMRYERIGLDRPTEELEGLQLPSYRLPARPAGTLAAVVEVAVKEHLQRQQGVVAAARLDARLREEMQ